MSRLGGFNPNTSQTYWPTTCHVFSFYNFLPYTVKLKPKTGKKKKSQPTVTIKRCRGNPFCFGHF